MSFTGKPINKMDITDQTFEAATLEMLRQMTTLRDTLGAFRVKWSEHLGNDAHLNEAFTHIHRLAPSRLDGNTFLVNRPTSAGGLHGRYVNYGTTMEDRVVNRKEGKKNPAVTIKIPARPAGTGLSSPPRSPKRAREEDDDDEAARPASRARYVAEAPVRLWKSPRRPAKEGAKTKSKSR